MIAKNVSKFCKQVRIQGHNVASMPLNHMWEAVGRAYAEYSSVKIRSIEKVW